MNDKEKKSKVLAFLRAQMLGVVSTIGHQNPESAVVAFGETENLELYFGTSNNSRKYKNIKNNPHIAFVIGWDDDVHISIQYEGIARELSTEEAKHYIEAFALKNPKTIKFKSYPDQRYFLITPSWIRYTSKEGDFELAD